MSGAGSHRRTGQSDENDRSSGRDAQETNIAAGRAVASVIRTTLGPRGMDKLLVDSIGQVIITNDGVTVLDEMNLEHPAADMVVEVAETQEATVGDGTTSAVILTGGLLSKAQELIERGVHPTSITAGYKRAGVQAKRAIADQAIEVKPDDRATLEGLARTAMTGKVDAAAREELARIIVDAACHVQDADGQVDLDAIEFHQVSEGAIQESRLIEGVVIKKTAANRDMPTSLADATVALVNKPLSVADPEREVNMNFADTEELDALVDRKERKLRKIVDHLEELGVDAVFTLKEIDNVAKHFLGRGNILGLRRLRDIEADGVATATGATPVNTVEELDVADLGVAETIRETTIGGKARTVVTGQADRGGSASIVIRGGTEHIVQEIERALEDSLHVVRAVLEGGQVVPGSGAPEVAAAMGLRDHADQVAGREQLAISAAAEVFEAIPRTLAENAGHDQIDSLAKLRSEHAAGNESVGLDAYTGEVRDMREAGVLEPLRVKTQAIDSAVEAAVMILRIDDVIDAKASDDDTQAGMPPGMAGPGGPM